jgi:hypothetical protein
MRHRKSQHWPNRQEERRLPQQSRQKNLSKFIMLYQFMLVICHDMSWFVRFKPSPSLSTQKEYYGIVLLPLRIFIIKIIKVYSIQIVTLWSLGPSIDKSLATSTGSSCLTSTLNLHFNSPATFADWVDEKRNLKVETCWNYAKRWLNRVDLISVNEEWMKPSLDFAPATEGLTGTRQCYAALHGKTYFAHFPNLELGLGGVRGFGSKVNLCASCIMLHL